MRNFLVILGLVIAVAIPSWAVDEDAGEEAIIPALLLRIERVSKQESLLEEMLTTNTSFASKTVQQVLDFLTDDEDSALYLKNLNDILLMDQTIQGAKEKILAMKIEDLKKEKSANRLAIQVYVDGLKKAEEAPAPKPMTAPLPALVEVFDVQAAFKSKYGHDMTNGHYLGNEPFPIETLDRTSLSSDKKTAMQQLAARFAVGRNGVTRQSLPYDAFWSAVAQLGYIPSSGWSSDPDQQLRHMMNHIPESDWAKHHPDRVPHSWITQMFSSLGYTIALQGKKGDYNWELR